jgi:very-short-patch-repair endonuclease
MTTPDLAQMRRHSILEWTLWHQLEQSDLPMPAWQRSINGPHNTKAHKVDFAWGEPWMLIVEIQGGTRGLGRHSRELGYSEDRLRAIQYQLDGWMVLEFTAEQVNSGTALAWIKEVFSDSTTSGTRRASGTSKS